MALAEILSELHLLLVEAIPQAIAYNNVPQPLCCLRINYFDSHAPLTYLTLRTQSEALRQQILAKQSEGNVAYELWASAEETRDADVDIPRDCEVGPVKERITKLFADLDEVEESTDVYMESFQALLRAVARDLNQADWRPYCQVSDDFVVAPADGSQFFAGDEDYQDIAQSISAEHMQKLIDRKLIGPNEDDWEQESEH